MNLLAQTNGVCGNCPTRHGECPACGTFWEHGFGFRVHWGPSVRERFLAEMRELAVAVGLPPGVIQVLELRP